MSAVPLSDLVVVLQSFTYKIDGEPPITWDINRARVCVACGLVEKPEPIALTPANMQDIADSNEWDPAHLDDVDPARPGIAAPLIVDGEIVYILIDGHHRNARALRDGLPFSAWLLADDASRDCITSGPSARIP